MQVRVGDFADVRCVVVGVFADSVIVRLPGRSALHQIGVDPHLIQNVAARSLEAAAADEVCTSYLAHLPDRRASRA
jgi:hypothetical protein